MSVVTAVSPDNTTLEMVGYHLRMLELKRDHLSRTELATTADITTGPLLNVLLGRPSDRSTRYKVLKALGCSGEDYETACDSLAEQARPYKALYDKLEAYKAGVARLRKQPVESLNGQESGQITFDAFFSEAIRRYRNGRENDINFAGRLLRELEKALNGYQGWPADTKHMTVSSYLLKQIEGNRNVEDESVAKILMIFNPEDPAKALEALRDAVNDRGVPSKGAAQSGEESSEIETSWDGKKDPPLVLRVSPESEWVNSTKFLRIIGIIESMSGYVLGPKFAKPSTGAIDEADYDLARTALLNVV